MRTRSHGGCAVADAVLTEPTARGESVDGHGRPIAGAKLEIFHAADNGDYAGLYDDGVPEYNLRGHRFTDSAGRYSHTTVTPSSRPTPTPTSRRSRESPRPARPSAAASTARPTSTTRSTTPT
jgi:protocatechuate 3,4-dioxygenase beta subunit